MIISYTSTDGGTTWVKRDPTGKPEKWDQIVCSSDGTNLTAIVSGGYLYNSMDSGVTWSRMDPGGTPQMWSALAASGDGDRLAATVYGGHMYTGQYGE